MDYWTARSAMVCVPQNSPGGICKFQAAVHVLLGAEEEESMAVGLEDVRLGGIPR